MNKFIKVGLFILLATVVANLIEIITRSNELKEFLMGGPVPIVPAVICSFLLLGIILIVVGLFLRFFKPKSLYKKI